MGMSENEVNISRTGSSGPVSPWEKQAVRGSYRLEQNQRTGTCRIRDSKGNLVDWGTQDDMDARLAELCPQVQSIRPQYGDIIGVHRMNGLYDHYGVYESDDCVYEYAAQDQDFGDADIHRTTLDRFVGAGCSFFILQFPDRSGIPEKREVGARDFGRAGELWGTVQKALFRLRAPEYPRLYSPEETVQRARSRLGERNYNIVTNNCEHFAIWCKTGLQESTQVTALLNAIALARQTVQWLGEQRNSSGEEPPGPSDPNP